MALHPRIIGVVNITEDSFSDGGDYLAPESAIARAQQLAADGAHAVELGPASSHPDAKPVAAATEIARLEPVLGALAGSGIRIGIDSFQPETQAWALEQDIVYLNDIQGFREAALHSALARSECQLILMHSIQRQGPATRARADAAAVICGIEAFFDERVATLTRAGIDRERLILDPGMGFFLGDEPEPSLRALRWLPALKARTGCRLLVSVSRKSFLGALTGRPPEERGAATLAAELYAAERGVDYLRTHDVRSLHDALTVRAALGGRV